MKKKLILALSLVALLVCLFAITASAATLTGVDVGGVYYDLTTGNDGNTAAVSKSNQKNACSLTTVVIPEEVTYDGVTYKVTSIAGSAFEDNDTVESIRIESPYITKIPNSFILNTYDGALRSIYIDFTKITRIESAGLNAGAQSNGNSPMANEIYYYDLDKNKITKFDFANIEFIGFAAFQGVNFDEIVINENTELGLSNNYSQCFRMSTASKFVLKGERTAIYAYQFESMSKLEEIKIESTSLTSIRESAFSGCTALERIYIDLSGVEQVYGSAFRFSGVKGVEQELVQWYNLDGEKIVDLSSVKSFGGTQAFNGSNLGSAQVIWPTNFTSSNFGHSSDSGAFRSAGIKGTVYFDAAEGTNLFIDAWAFRGNEIETVIFGPNVTKVAACFSDVKTIKTVVFLADNVECTSSDLFKNCSGITFYHKTLTTNTTFSQATQINISDGSYIAYGACGIKVDLTPVEGEKVTLDLVSHDYKGEADQTVCPAGSLVVYTCAGCKDSYEEKLENYIGGTHDFLIENGATVAKIVYECNNYFENGVVVIKCASCSAQNNDTEISPLFESVGYSTNEVLNGFISHTIKVNVDAIDEYKNYTGTTVNYGVMASVATSNPLTIENGKVVATGKAIAAEMSNTSYTTLLIKVHGITSNEAMNCNAYVAIDGAITYLCGDEALDSPVEKSLNISNATVEQTSVEAILQETKQYA